MAKRRKGTTITEDEILKWLDENDPATNDPNIREYVEVEENYINGRWNRKETIHKFRRIKL